MISLSSVFIIFHAIGLLILAIKAVKSIKDKQTKSKLLTFVKGLNQNKRLYPILYFIHYFGIRFIVAFMILLTPETKSYVFWLFIVLGQLVCLGIHVF